MTSAVRPFLPVQGSYRIPVDFALVRRTADPAYQPENALFRQMLQAFRRSA